MVHQLIHAGARVVALVAGNGDAEIGGQHPAAVLLQDLLDAVAGREEILARALDHVEHHHGLAVLTGEAVRFLVGIVHRGDVAEAHFLLIDVLHHDVADLRHVGEFADHAHGAALPIGEQFATAHGEVLHLDGLGNVVEVELQRLQLIQIETDAHLALGYAADVHLVDLRQGFDAVLQVLRIGVELLHRVVAAEVDVHHRHQLAEVELDHVRLRGQVRGEVLVAARLVHRVLHLAQGLIWRDVVVELHIDGAEVRHRGALDLVHPADGVDLLFQGLGDELLDVHHRTAVVRRGDEYLRRHHLGEALLGHHLVGVDPHQEDQHREHDHRSAVLHRPCRDRELPLRAVEVLFYVFVVVH